MVGRLATLIVRNKLHTRGSIPTFCCDLLPTLNLGIHSSMVPPPVPSCIPSNPPTLRCPRFPMCMLKSLRYCHVCNYSSMTMFALHSHSWCYLVLQCGASRYRPVGEVWSVEENYQPILCELLERCTTCCLTCFPIDLQLLSQRLLLKPPCSPLTSTFHWALTYHDDSTICWKG